LRGLNAEPIQDAEPTPCEQQSQNGDSNDNSYCVQLPLTSRRFILSFGGGSVAKSGDLVFVAGCGQANSLPPTLATKERPSTSVSSLYIYSLLFVVGVFDARSTLVTIGFCVVANLVQVG
jgi:hypothetical protein